MSVRDGHCECSPQSTKRIKKNLDTLLSSQPDLYSPFLFQYKKQILKRYQVIHTIMTYLVIFI